jgi:hypothetical protein
VLAKEALLGSPTPTTVSSPWKFAADIFGFLLLDVTENSHDTTSANLAL